MKILRDDPRFSCDFTVQFDADRQGSDIKLLQITDMQFIDAAQRRTPDRLRPDEIKAWDPENFDAQCGNHIRSLVAQTKPDIIFTTGDNVYGSFDDDGSALDYFCDLMDSFCIPWAPVFGNHDNETKRGVEWQCERLASSKYCLFKKGEVSGNGNYSLGIAVGDRLLRVMYMTDSHGCLQKPAIHPDQMEFIKHTADKIKISVGRTVPAFMAFHAPTLEFRNAEEAAGYCKENALYTIGVDVAAQNGDFGFKLEPFHCIRTEFPFMESLKTCGIDGVFVGHCHSINTSILYDGVRFTFGLKTGQYDYHIAGCTGGTLITLCGSKFEIQHVPSLVRHAPYPAEAPLLRGFYTE